MTNLCRFSRVVPAWLTLALLVYGVVGAAEPPKIEVLERRDLPGGLVREKLRLPGCDPDETVPAIAFHPATNGPYPVCFVLHYFQGSKEASESWCRDLAARGIFAIAIDAHLHGERSIAGVFRGDHIAELGEEYSIWVHQTSIAHTARDVSTILDALGSRSDVDLSRVAATGMSMGGSTAMVLAWREPRVQVVASMVGAVDFWWDVTKTPPGAAQDAKRASFSPRLTELVTSLDPRTRLAQIPPKAVCLLNGGHDGFIDMKSVRQFVEELQPLYREHPDRLRFTPYPDAGHEVTAAMWRETQEWLARELKAGGVGMRVISQ